jgi:photosystem II stability/assembly factor-like uncharacterized protein
LFGGIGSNDFLSNTWAWDGSTWTRQALATHPPARANASMAYDAATATGVLFGGISRTYGFLIGTWTWNGSTWAKHPSSTHPPARYYASMAYDAATATIVLFGGSDKTSVLGDTWTWGSSG